MAYIKAAGDEVLARDADQALGFSKGRSAELAAKWTLYLGVWEGSYRKRRIDLHPHLWAYYRAGVKDAS